MPRWPKLNTATDFNILAYKGRQFTRDSTGKAVGSFCQDDRHQLSSPGPGIEQKLGKKTFLYFYPSSLHPALPRSL